MIPMARRNLCYNQHVSIIEHQEFSGCDHLLLSNPRKIVWLLEGGFSLKRVLYLYIAGLLLLVGLLGCETTGGSIGGSPTPTPTGTTAAAPSPTGTASGGGGVNAELTRLATAYYNDIQAKNYQQAYTYLDPQATDANGKTITLSSFEQMAQMMDYYGPITSFSVDAFAPMVIMTVSRPNLAAYHAHLQMKQEGSTWKIISVDRL